MIERQVINGRQASVAYLADGFAPCSRASATLVKVIFDDGECLFLVPRAEPAKKYSDDEPRDERGRWTSGGGGEAKDVRIAERDIPSYEGGGSVLERFGDKMPFKTKEDLQNFAVGLARGFPADELSVKLEAQFNMHKFDRVLMTVTGQTTDELSGFERSFSFWNDRPATVDHTAFVLADKLQGKGIARDFLQSNIEAYKTLGITRVSLYADAEVGGYAWAKFGFAPDTDVMYTLALSGRIAGKPVEQLRALQAVKAPKDIWALADSPSGKAALLGTSWNGHLDLNDPVAMGRFNAYVKRGGATEKLDVPTGKGIVVYEWPDKNLPKGSRDGMWEFVGVEKYSDDEPRDERGRWTSGGGGASADKGNEASALLAASGPTMSPEAFNATLTPEQRAAIKGAHERLSEGIRTDSAVSQGGYVKPDGTYTDERQAVHQEILNRIFTEKAIQAARPSGDEKPTYTMLGGRGGSGKSNLTKESGPLAGHRALLLDNDWIKSQLPGYQGWNAALYHEEASHIFERADAIARVSGLNVIHDSTMRTATTAERYVAAYKGAGYDIQGYYMFAPPNVAAQRAMNRFTESRSATAGSTGRFVPPEIILASQTNEASFDKVKSSMSHWAIYTSIAGHGGSFGVKLVAQK